MLGNCWTLESAVPGAVKLLRFRGNAVRLDFSLLPRQRVLRLRLHPADSHVLFRSIIACRSLRAADAVGRAMDVQRN